ncbi:MAG: alpha-L-fucosidase [Verrucomicrobia bacterium]|nr:alpha-L-fucosidase [Verrucomicrobiota bacterium]
MASLTPYSQAGGVWKGEKVKGYAEWMQSKHKIKKDEYVQLLKTFNPSKFDADLLVRTAKQAGMKYLVITAKHHEGFCLWDSKYTEYDVASTPFKGRDILEELNKACEKHGIKYGIYYSILDWHHPSQSGLGHQTEMVKGRSTLTPNATPAASAAKKQTPISWAPASRCN